MSGSYAQRATQHAQMDPSFAQCFLIGTVSELETVRLSGGKTKVKVLLMVKEEPWRIEFWEPVAEWILQHVNAGQMISVTGHLAIQRWETREGHARKSVIIQGHNFHIVRW